MINDKVNKKSVKEPTTKDNNIDSEHKDNLENPRKAREATGLYLERWLKVTDKHLPFEKKFKNLVEYFVVSGFGI